jgi:adenosylhomocysteinase
MIKHDIKDIREYKKGRMRIEWAAKDMPVLGLIRERFKKEKPLKGIKIACCLHVTTETANLMLTLKTGGAQLALCASNPLSTQDDVAACLVKDGGIWVFAVKGENRQQYYRHIKNALSIKPHITMDDGADLVSTVHRDTSACRLLGKYIIGGTEETTTGVIRLRALAQRDGLLYPIVAVNDALTKHLFDNRYGTGQSTIDGIIRATNKLISGSNFVVLGYGFCGRGVAMRARGMGAKTIVCEVDPLKALEAAMDGYQVMSKNEASKVGDIFLTTTGDINVLTREQFLNMKDGAILANSGHFNVEIDIDSLRKLARKIKKVKEHIEEFVLKNGRRLYLLTEGRLVNLAAAQGHPASVMDMSFANQALSVEFIINNSQKLKKRVYNVPKEIDEMIAKLKLKSMGIAIDSLTKEQKEYLSSWEMGT